MRRLLALCTAFVLLTAFMLPYSASPVAAADEPICWVLEISLRNNTHSVDTASAVFFNEGNGFIYGPWTDLVLNPGESGVLRLAAFFAPEIRVGWGGFWFMRAGTINFGTADASACGGGVAQIADGRVNASDLAAPVAMYCEANGLVVYHIDRRGRGTFAFRVSDAEMETALDEAAASGQNVLIAEASSARLYALTTGELSLFAPDVKEPGKTYSAVIAGDTCG